MERPADPTRYSRIGLGLLLGLIALIGFISFVLEKPVPLLAQIDLGVHESSHLLGSIFGERAHFIAGSAGQILVPLLFAAVAAAKRSAPAAAFCIAWAGASCAEVAVYIADAPYQRLPLVGGGTHDWAWLLGPEQWDALGSAESIAAWVSEAGFTLCLIAAGAALWMLYRPPLLPRLGSGR